MTSNRLNGFIRALEKGEHAITTFVPMDVDAAIAHSEGPYDGVIFEGEHHPWNLSNLRHSLQYMLNRAQIQKAGSIAPTVTPIARIPANGVEMNQYLAKQALDAGCYGIVFPHISTVEEAYNAVAACRYPRLKGKPLYEPAGIRGDGPATAARYWGLSQQEYYKRADVWPLAPEGELLAVIQIEDLTGISNLDDMLKNVPGIGVILIGEGDLSQELGCPRDYENKDLLEAMAEVVAICKANNVVVGHPHVETINMERVVAEGYRFLMASSPRSFDKVKKLRGVTGKA